jgi:hypothetical protein
VELVGDGRERTAVLIRLYNPATFEGGEIRPSRTRSSWP